MEYKLLVLDDEPLIVNGLVSMLGEIGYPEGIRVVILKAYSAYEALDMMRETPADLILSDINMPQMSGLELQKKIRENWPKCRIIFLTGYDVFDYIHEAIRNEAVDYILKSENENDIKNAVKKTVLRLAEEERRKRMEKGANERLNKMIPVLKDDFFEKLLNGEITVTQELIEQTEALRIELDSEKPIMIFIARIDSLRLIAPKEDKISSFIKMQNVLEDYFALKFLWIQIKQTMNLQLFLLQPVYSEEDLQGAGVQKSGYVDEAFETLKAVQEECKKLFGFSISFYLSDYFVEWIELHRCCYEMEIFANARFGQKDEILVVSRKQENEEGISDAADAVNTVHQVLKKLNLLQKYLDLGQREEFEGIYREIMDSLVNCIDLERELVIEVYYSFWDLFINCINKYNLKKMMVKILEYSSLQRLETELSLKDVFAYFRTLADEIFNLRREKSDCNFNGKIKKFEDYIEEHLAEELSLNTLSERFNFNSSYISRQFKLNKGIGLVEYINERRIEMAKKLILEENYKIYDISRKVGFENTTYFSKLFKKYTGLNPQEFKERFKLTGE